MFFFKFKNSSDSPDDLKMKVNFCCPTCQISTFPKIFSKQKQGISTTFSLGFFCGDRPGFKLLGKSMDRGFTPMGPNGPTLQEEVDRLEAGLSRPGSWDFSDFFDTTIS